MLVFEERGKPEYPEKNLSEQSREPTNSAHLWRRIRESNPGHIGRRVVYHCANPAPQYAQSSIMLLPQYLSDDIERLRKRALRIMCPNVSCNEALEALGIPALFCRRKEISNSLFRGIVQDKSHKLHSLLPLRNTITDCTRSKRYFRVPPFKNTFIINESSNYT